ncbi:MAG: peptide deformylase [Thermodesulfobacteriota bacterium]|nr:peptide deformylase [Thermodesulfobacteriota bacterium]
MTVLEIITYPAEILAKEASPVTALNENIRQLIKDMADTMYAKMGIGLAAVQVGSDSRIVVYDISEDREPQNYQVVVNPEIVETRGTYLSEKEGCLSVPELRTDVKRHEVIRVEGLDADGNPVLIEARNLEAAVLQHEIDHLNGTLILDHASALKRQMYKKKVKKHLKS